MKRHHTVTQKRQPVWGCLFVNFLAVPLKLLGQLGIVEVTKVVVYLAGKPNRVAKLESKRMRWIFAEEVGRADGEGGIIQDSLPAGHAVSSGRLNLLLTTFLARHHFLATLGISSHWLLLHRRREHHRIGQLCVHEPGWTDPVLFPEPIKLRGIDFFPPAVFHVEGEVQVPVLPGPVDGGGAFPFHPAVAVGDVAEEATRPPIVVGPTCYLPRPCPRETEDKLIEIAPSAQERPGPVLGLELILEAEVNTIRPLATAVDVWAANPGKT